MITESQIMHMVATATQQLNAIGYYPAKVKVVKFVNATSFYARVWQDTGRLDVSSYYRDAPFYQIQATIMHEMIHLIPGIAHGHGNDWKFVASKVNSTYPEYSINRVGNNASEGTDYDLRKVAKTSGRLIKRPTYVQVECSSCGKLYRVSSRSRILTHLTDYRCTCKSFVRLKS